MLFDVLDEWHLSFISEPLTGHLACISLPLERSRAFLLVLKPLLLLLAALELEVLVDGDLGGPVDLEGEQQRRSLLGLEHRGLLGHDVQNRIVPHRFVDEGDVDLGRKALIDFGQLLLQEAELLLVGRLLQDFIREVGQGLHEARSRQVSINKVLVFGEVREAAERLLPRHLLLHVVEVLQDDVASFELEWSPLALGPTDPLESESIRVLSVLKLVRRGLWHSASVGGMVLHGHVDLHPAIGWLRYLLVGASSSPAIADLEDLANRNLPAVRLEANLFLVCL